MELFISPTGNDAASGSQSAPWKTLSRLSSTVLDAGTVVRLQRGGVWNEQLRLTGKSGFADGRIVIGSYGSGPLPLIDVSGPMKNWGSGWSLFGGNVWSHDCSVNPGRMYTAVNSGPLVEGGSAYSLDDLKMGMQTDWTDNGIDTLPRNWRTIFPKDPLWFWDAKNTVYVRAPLNPADYFSQIIISNTNDHACQITLSNFLTLQDLKLMGGERGMDIDASQSIVLDNCDIGERANVEAILIEGRSHNGEIKNCIIDRKFGMIDYFEYGGGVRLDGSGNRMVGNGRNCIGLASANDWNIHHNIVSGWCHDGIIAFPPSGEECKRNRVHHNTLNNTTIYGRALCFQQDWGNPEACSDNEFSYNIVNGSTVGIRMVGARNKAYYNIVHGIRWKPYKANGHSSGFSKNLYQGPGGSLSDYFLPAYECELVNNTFFDCDADGVCYFGGHVSGKIINNLIVNTGLVKDPHLAYDDAAAQQNGHSDGTFNAGLSVWTKAAGTPGNKAIIKNNIVVVDDGRGFTFHQDSWANSPNRLTGEQFDNVANGNSDFVTGGNQSKTLQEIRMNFSDGSLGDGSAAIGAGIPTAYKTDIYGKTVGSNPSVGAVEGSSIAPPPPPPPPPPVVPPIMMALPMVFPAPAGGGSFPIKVTNIGGGTLSWETVDHVPWIVSDSDTEGQITLQVAPNLGPARVGPVTINSNASNTPIILAVNQAAVVSVDPLPILIAPTAVFVGESAGSVHLSITNAGGGSLVYSLIATLPWMHAAVSLDGLDVSWDVNSGTTARAGVVLIKSNAKNPLASIAIIQAVPFETRIVQ